MNSKQVYLSVLGATFDIVSTSGGVTHLERSLDMNSAQAYSGFHWAAFDIAPTSNGLSDIAIVAGFHPRLYQEIDRLLPDYFKAKEHERTNPGSIEKSIEENRPMTEDELKELWKYIFGVGETLYASIKIPLLLSRSENFEVLVPRGSLELGVFYDSLPENLESIHPLEP